ncbi:MFS transporter [Leptospira sp. 201903075]|uniref:MFS transporter n=1 Tax=Leptospira chreensis TaxID=2810035 RepID=UPI0019625FC3|nr:MFS transporter [Leptospira chreensis]MBM9591697.1 MFS transporter [Leptospira chreensis]
MNKNNYLYLLSTIFGYTAIVMFNYFVIIYSHDLTKADSLGASLFLLIHIPFVLLGLITGIIIDFNSKRKILIISQATYIIGNLFFAFLIYTTDNKVYISNYLFLLSIILGFSFSFLPATRLAIIGQLTKNELKGKMTVFVNLSYIFAFGFGPLFVGFIKEYYFDFLIPLLIAFLFLISNFILFFVKLIPLEIKQFVSIRRGINDLIQYLNQNREIVYLLMLVPLTTFLLGPFQILIPTYGETIFKLGDSVKPIYFLILAVGLGFGGFLQLVLKDIKLVYIIFGASMISAVAIFVFMPIEVLTLNILIIFISSVCCSVSTNYLVSMIQMRINEEYRSRILSLYSILQLGVSAFLGLIAAKVSDKFGPVVAFQNFGFLLFVFSLFIILVFRIRNFNLDLRLKKQTL